MVHSAKTDEEQKASYQTTNIKAEAELKANEKETFDPATNKSCEFDIKKVKLPEGQFIVDAEANGTQAERRRNADGTQTDRRRNANGTQTRRARSERDWVKGQITCIQ